MLATAARMGKRPALTVTDLMTSLRRLLAVIYAGALLSGIIGFFLAQQGLIRLSGFLAERVPPDRRARFLADAWAHTASYGMGSLAASFWL